MRSLFIILILQIVNCDNNKNTLIGGLQYHKNVDETTVIGIEHNMSYNDKTTAIGHDHLILNSSKTITFGSNINSDNADRNTLIGSHIQSNNDNVIMIGANLSDPQKAQVVIGFHNKKSDAVFVIANGTSNEPTNIFEVYQDGRIATSQVENLQLQIEETLMAKYNDLLLRVLELEKSLHAHDNQTCGYECGFVKSAYKKKCCTGLNNDIMFL
jgi:hypothetical protein